MLGIVGVDIARTIAVEDASVANTMSAPAWQVITMRHPRIATRGTYDIGKLEDHAVEEEAAIVLRAYSDLETANNGVDAVGMASPPSPMLSAGLKKFDSKKCHMRC